MLPTVCFFLGMAMMACTIVGYACIRVGSMSEHGEMRAGDNGKAIDGQHGNVQFFAHFDSRIASR